MNRTVPPTERPVPSFNTDLAGRLGAAGVDLAGSLYAVPAEDREAAAQLLGRRGHWIHADVFADARAGVSLTLITRLAELGVGPIDVHLLDRGAMDALPIVCRAGITRITVPHEGTDDVEAVAARIRAVGADPWLAIAPGTRVEDCADALRHVEGLLVMLIQPGTKDTADPGLLDKVQTVHGQRPAGVDGGVDETTIDRILAAGTSYVVVGRRLFTLPPGATHPPTDPTHQGAHR